MVRSAGDWPWSSYQSTVGQRASFNALSTDWLLSSFASTKSVAIERYKKFIFEGKGQPSPWTELRNQVYLGGQEFVEEMQGLIDDDKELSEVPISQRRPKPQKLEYYDLNFCHRNESIVNAYLSGGYSLKEVGDYFGLHYSSISGIVRNHKSKT